MDKPEVLTSEIAAMVITTHKNKLRIESFIARSVILIIRFSNSMNAQ
jgi:hypothetical protein